MSLVLNTNNSGGGGYALSNKDILTMYPDCDNNILLANDAGRYIGAGETITEIFNVNGTKISSISGTICMPEYWKTFQAMFAYQTQYFPAICGFDVHTYGRNVLTAIDRLSTPMPIKSGLTIGKTVVIPEFYVGNASSISASNFSIQLKVGILHSDGSITYIAEGTAKTYLSSGKTIKLGQLETSSGGIDYVSQGSKQVINTAGFTTQEGDYIIAETRVKAPNSYFYIVFGTLTPENSNQRLGVFQISVD